MLNSTTRVPFRTSSNLLQLSRIQLVVVTVSTPCSRSAFASKVESVAREESERESACRRRKAQKERREELTMEEDLVDSFDE